MGSAGKQPAHPWKEGKGEQRRWCTRTVKKGHQEVGSAFIRSTTGGGAWVEGPCLPMTSTK